MRAPDLSIPTDERPAEGDAGPPVWRALVLVYAVFAYLALLVVFATLVLFVGGASVVRGIDDAPTASTSVALTVDLCLVAIFGASHSAFARPSFKEFCARIVPRAVERSTYVLVTDIVLAMLVWQWRALPGEIWMVSVVPVVLGIRVLSGAGVVLMFVSTFLTDHFDLFGLRQAWLYARGRSYAPVPFQMRGLYKWMRHPMMTGILLWIWATPQMTAGHLVFATSLTAYILVGVAFEERDLVRSLGADYVAYRRRVSAFLPLRRG